MTTWFIQWLLWKFLATYDFYATFFFLDDAKETSAAGSLGMTSPDVAVEHWQNDHQYKYKFLKKIQAVYDLEIFVKLTKVVNLMEFDTFESASWPNSSLCAQAVENKSKHINDIINDNYKMHQAHKNEKIQVLCLSL